MNIDRVFATYEFEPKRTYGGSDISCGMYKSRKAIERACTENDMCIGYSTISADHYTISVVEDREGENGFYAWCLKSTEGLYQADEGHNYYRRTRGIQYTAANCIKN